MSNEATSLATTLQVFDEDGWYHGRRVGPVLEKMREKQGKLTLSTTTAPQHKSAIFKRGWKLRSSILVCLLGRLQDGQAQLSAGPRADTSHGGGIMKSAVSKRGPVCPSPPPRRPESLGFINQRMKMSASCARNEGLMTGTQRLRVPE